MNVHLKNMIATLPLLTGSALALAGQPLVLDAASMDRITAGSRAFFERLAGVLDTLPGNVGGTAAPLMERLNDTQAAALMRALEGERIVFRQTGPGQLTATQKLASGQTLVLVKQLSSDAQAAAATSAQSNGRVTTYVVNPGESVNVQQANTNGVNYLYIRSNGSSAVHVTQRSGF